ncbi:MAG: hypothetical protein K8R17_13260 [Methanosarcinales archaeon]|nr:hypothetical protein [Methanosarcinales archaeon]
MEKSKEDIKLDKIGKLLELGGTMLANHCECGAPLFRYHGNVICPICDSNSKEPIESQKKKQKTHREPGKNPPLTSSQVEQKIQKVQTPKETIPLPENQHLSEASQSFTKVPQPLTEAQQVTAQPTGTHSNISPETYEFISNTIVNKVVQLCLDLQRETDQGRIKQQMEAIESGTRALKNLR